MHSCLFDDSEVRQSNIEVHRYTTLHLLIVKIHLQPMLNETVSLTTLQINNKLQIYNKFKLQLTIKSYSQQHDICLLNFASGQNV